MLRFGLYCFIVYKIAAPGSTPLRLSSHLIELSKYNFIRDIDFLSKCIHSCPVGEGVVKASKSRRGGLVSNNIYIYMAS